MNVSSKDDQPECNVQVDGSTVCVNAKTAGAATVVEIDLSPDRPDDKPLITIHCEPDQGKAETLSVK